MIYSEAAPGRLAPWVRCVWSLRGEVSSAPQPILPDGCLELVLHLGQPFLQETQSGAVAQPAALVAGQLVAPLRVASGGPADVVGVRFRPAGARALLGLPLRELTGSVWALEELAPALARDLVAHLAELPPAARRIELEERLLRVLVAGGEPDARVSRAVAALQTTPRVEVTALARRLGTSARGLERAFAREVGVGPRFLARLLRFQRALRALGAGATPGPGGWAAVAARCGYADQAHLIRDFRAFAGESPERFRAAGHDLAQHLAGLRAGQTDSDSVG